jgi:type IV secretory pathway VirB10-like protein
MKKHAFFSPRRSGGGRAHRQTAYSVASVLSIGLTGLLLLGGCKKTTSPAGPAAEPTSTAQAAPTPAATPESAPAAPAPAESAAAPPPPPAPAPPPPPPPPQQYVVPTGAPLVVRVGQTLSAKNNNVGDTFTGTLAQSVVVHGVKVIKAGTPVTGTVVAAKGRGRFKGSGDLGIAINRVGSYSVVTTSYEARPKARANVPPASLVAALAEAR